MTNIKRYNKVFIEVFGCEESELTDEYTFANVEKWDSFAHLSLISELEDAFDVMFETDDILHFGGYENGKKILSRYGVEFED